ncbi:MAG TPA: hypothetical protein VF432_33635 [Thermoanaerobaculia bacterium]
MMFVLLACLSLSASAQWSSATNVQWTNNNVGIGTSTPAAKLHVAGNTLLGGALNSRTLVPFFQHGTNVTGYTKLITPLAGAPLHGAFTLTVRGFRATTPGQAFTAVCGAMLLADGVLYQPACHVEGLALPVELATELRPGATASVVVMRIGTPTAVWGSYSGFVAEYTGMTAADAAAFTWSAGEATPAQGPNMNAVVVDDLTGRIGIGATSSGLLTIRGETGSPGAAPVYIDSPNPAGYSVVRLNSTAGELAKGGALASYGPSYNGAVTAAYAPSTTTLSGFESNGLALAAYHADGNVRVYTGGYAAAAERLRITKDGNVGIGTSAPQHKLHVIGSIHATSVIGSTYQDVAEWVPATVDMEPGTVVVLNPGRTNEVMPSSRPYDTTVAGVVSEQPGILLGIGDASKEQVATTGRVKVRVDATSAPIRVGDLLVTSGRSGVAMRSEPMDIRGRTFHQPGTIIGKALEPLAGGTGEILVLLSLQ